MSHVTHTNESCHTCEYVMSHTYQVSYWFVDESCHTSEWVMSHIWMSHVTHLNEACDSSNIWISHVTQMNEGRPSSTWWVTLHIWMSHVTPTKKSCFTSRWVASLWVQLHMDESCRSLRYKTWRIHNTNESLHSHEEVLFHIWVVCEFSYI